MLLVKHQADSECDLGSGCFGRNPDIGKSKARQLLLYIYFLDYLHQNHLVHIQNKCRFLDPRFTESESLEVKPRIIYS